MNKMAFIFKLLLHEGYLEFPDFLRLGAANKHLNKALDNPISRLNYKPIYSKKTCHINQIVSQRCNVQVMFGIYKYRSAIWYCCHCSECYFRCSHDTKVAVLIYLKRWVRRNKCYLSNEPENKLIRTTIHELMHSHVISIFLLQKLVKLVLNVNVRLTKEWDQLWPYIV